MFKKYLSWFGFRRFYIISFNGLILSVTELANIGIFIAYISSFSVEKENIRYLDIFYFGVTANFISFLACMLLGAVVRIILFNNFRRIVREVTKDVFSILSSGDSSGVNKQRSKLPYVNQGVRSFAQICTGFFYCVTGILIILLMVHANFKIIFSILSIFLILIILYLKIGSLIFTKISGSLNKELEELATTSSSGAVKAAKSATDHQASINMKNQAITIFVQNSIFVLLGSVMFISQQIAVTDVLGLVLMVSRLTPKLLEFIRGINVLISIQKVMS